ncbi:hypothetical protein [Mucilaginibacter pallidiroseus]|nr:hypothetical protein [Mucilaginibacter pallidiroseus]
MIRKICAYIAGLRYCTTKMPEIAIKVSPEMKANNTQNLGTSQPE